MLLQYCSDLHLEFPENRHFLAAKPLVPRARILILAGDIIPFTTLSAHEPFFDQLTTHFERIYWLPGNHEYYGGDAGKRSGSFQELIRPNLILTNNCTFEEGDTRLIFSTLWTHISPNHELDIQESLNDFHLITYDRRALRPSDVNQMHTESLDFLKTELARPTTGKTVVITHHVPTLFHYPDVYKGSVLNEAFAVELFPVIQDSGASHWIFGHHHWNMPDFHIGNTTLTTNQLGYVEKKENRGFRPDRTLEA
jgi:hypothetical protein